jgi:hypothetical protein
VLSASLVLISGSINFNRKNYFSVALKGVAMTQNAEFCLWNNYCSGGWIFSYLRLSDILEKYKKTLPQQSLLKGSGPMP